MIELEYYLRKNRKAHVSRIHAEVYVKFKVGKNNLVCGHAVISIHLKMGTSDVLINTCPPQQKGIKMPREDLTQNCPYCIQSPCLPVPTPTHLLPGSRLLFATISRAHLKSQYFAVYFGIRQSIFSFYHFHFSP